MTIIESEKFEEIRKEICCLILYSNMIDEDELLESASALTEKISDAGSAGEISEGEKQDLLHLLNAG